MNENEIITVDGKDLVVYDEETRSALDQIDNVTGYESVPLTHKMPYYKLFQEGKNAGSFYNQQTEDIYESLDILPVKFAMERCFFEKPFRIGSVPLCRSFDGLKPALSYFEREDAPESPVHHTCAVVKNGRLTFVCPFAVTEDENGNWGQAECQDQRLLYFVNLADSSPGCLVMAGIARKKKSPHKGFLTVETLMSYWADRRTVLNKTKATLVAKEYATKFGAKFMPLVLSESKGKIDNDLRSDLAPLILSIANYKTSGADYVPEVCASYESL